tara:strand:- start:232 stop:954 length:723 start_codon:yes stop_codon:yes gene_type:complete
MDKVSTIVNEVAEEPISFFQYMSNFDDDTKCELLNMGQYAILALVPVMVVLKGIKHFIPEEDESKGNFEILAESIGQIIVIMISIWFIDRLVRYVPTYSGCEYTLFNPVNFITPLLIILLTIQTKLGTKLNILNDRLNELWFGEEKSQTKGKTGGQVRVTQPLANAMPPAHQTSQADYLDQSQLLPSNPSLTAMPQIAVPSQGVQQAAPQMQGQQMAPLGASEPMAANEGMGGMFGGSAW